MDQQDFNMVMDDSGWPRWPVLPMKRKRGGNVEFGVVIAGSRRIVYLCSIFNTKGISDGTAEKVEYEAVEEMLADGWIVD